MSPRRTRRLATFSRFSVRSRTTLRTKKRKIAPAAANKESRRDISASLAGVTERALRRRVEDHLADDPTARGIAAALEHSGNAVRLPIPVRIWTEEESSGPEVEEALTRLLSVAGFGLDRANPSRKGSWYRSFAFRLRRAATSAELRRRLEKLERGIELQIVTKTQAEVDSAQGDAVAKLLASLEGTPTALVQIGSILLIKLDGVPIVRNLTQDEIALLDRDPALLHNPASALRALDLAARQRPSEVPAARRGRSGELAGESE
ncbi:hypothetical protein VSH64_03315 [Amycolatopsis rhabdoformis]|uniref:Uncharacterized protein n=1 Tax=Amycolatopsis rhabdoformis TaxID=1448059 RepID=A0ABZ1IAQ1_9PSEU|nr:hypothetical protein [Amycolatopsis rhabdoformis]WSE31146.1 hypothetical protein VSH64_03315 [Amycolatopsis rhabdoformis]